MNSNWCWVLVVDYRLDFPLSSAAPVVSNTVSLGKCPRVLRVRGISDRASRRTRSLQSILPIWIVQSTQSSIIPIFRAPNEA